VLGTRNFNEVDLDESQRNGPKMDAKEMEQLLREGAYAVLLEDDTDIIKEFYEAVSEICVILDWCLCVGAGVSV